MKVLLLVIGLISFLILPIVSMAQSSGQQNPPPEKTQLEQSAKKAADEVNKVEKSILEYNVTGEFSDPTNSTGVFAGRLRLTGFDYQDSHLVAEGQITDGLLTDSKGKVLKRVGEQKVTLPVSNQRASCKELDFQLGPSDVQFTDIKATLKPITFHLDADAPYGKLASSYLCSIGKSISSNLKTASTQLNELIVALTQE